MQSSHEFAVQAEHVLNTRLALGAALSDLSREVGIAYRGVKSSRHGVDLSAVYGGTSALRRVEEAYDLAQLDFATASGEDA